ncbi:uncharacterized protein LOC128722773 [Anopheles nili]|uniref:uncharacterized protein LOC128722773 n=1 Tax=Anopheles nili TaxID=185578 RepID=UPI00237A4B18|nr:uncharacterized protein LOC128722773 [Anopheles nili]
MTDINRGKQSYQHKHNGKIDPQSMQSPPGHLTVGLANPTEHGRSTNTGAGSSTGGSLKRNNSHHQRSKKSTQSSTLERGSNATGALSAGSFFHHHNHHHQQQQQSGSTGTRSCTGAGLAKSWSKTSSSSTSQSTSHGPAEQSVLALDPSGSSRPPGANLAPTVKTEATLGEDFKRFHTLRTSYGGKSNLNVNNTDHTIKSQVLLHQQKLREYARQLPSQQQQQHHHDNDNYSTCSSSQSDYQHPQHQQQQQHHRHKHHTHYRPHQHQHHPQPQPLAHGVQQQTALQSSYPVSATVAATATLTRAGGFGGASILKNATNSLKRGPGGLSTLSLCSCDAETEIIPNPLRPLYQYSLDRKNPRQHTYTCEQNAQILLRLEKDRQKKFGSMGKLHLATSTGDLSLATTAMQRHSSITGASVPTSSVSTPTPTPPPPLAPSVSGRSTGNACKAAATVLSFDCQHGSYPRGDNYAEDDSFSEDMIPPPPPPLNRRPSYGYGCVVQPVASGPEPMHDLSSQPPTVNLGCGHELDASMIGTGGPSYTGTMNQPDLFNFAANTNGPASSGMLKSTLKASKPSTNGKTTSGSSTTGTDGKTKLNAPEPLPVMMVDLMNGNATAQLPSANGNDPVGTKPYPPYYFDDNYLHHQYYYGNDREDRLGEPGSELPLKEAMDAGQLYLYHQHHHQHAPHPDPVTGGYIPNYDALNLPAKYNTIGANGDLPFSGHFSGVAGIGHHASSCNINQYAGSAKSNLIASHDHHFSNSISNFNFNPSQYFGSGLDAPPGTTIIPGSLGGVMGAGDGFPSSCSLNGTPNKQQPHPWKHRQCPSRGSSSTGSRSSSKIQKNTILSNLQIIINHFHFWAAYVPCEAQHKDAVQITLEQIDVIKRLTERFSPHLTSCASVFDIVQAHKNRQMCSLIGVEGGHSLGGSLGVLRIYYTLGVRYMTLTSTCHTPWTDSSNADAPKYDVRHGGLTAYGKPAPPAC